MKSDELSKNQKKLLLLLFLVSAFSILISTIAYAYLQGNVYYEGNNGVSVKSKEFDTLQMNSSQDAKFQVDYTNFSKDNGHDISGTTSIDINLDTTKESAKYCYKTTIVLPSEKIFTYSAIGRPELVLDVEYAADGVNYVEVINNKDITEAAGEMPVVFNGSDKYIISTTRRNPVSHKWKAKLTFLWLSDVDQYLNNNKTYEMKLKTDIVNCE